MRKLVSATRLLEPNFLGTVADTQPPECDQCSTPILNFALAFEEKTLVSLLILIYNWHFFTFNHAHRI